MIIVVTGSRDWRHEQFIRRVLDSVYVKHGIFTLYHGDCQDKDGNKRGADFHADTWGKEMEPHGIEVTPFPANWAALGYGAGPARNKQMMVQAAAAQSRGEKIHVVAFRRRENSKGTNNAIRCAIECGLPYQLYTEADVAALHRK